MLGTKIKDNCTDQVHRPSAPAYDRSRFETRTRPTSLYHCCSFFGLMFGIWLRPGKSTVALSSVLMSLSRSAEFPTTARTVSAQGQEDPGRMYAGRTSLVDEVVHRIAAFAEPDDDQVLAVAQPALVSGSDGRQRQEKSRAKTDAMKVAQTHSTIRFI